MTVSTDEVATSVEMVRLRVNSLEILDWTVDDVASIDVIVDVTISDSVELVVIKELGRGKLREMVGDDDAGTDKLDGDVLPNAIVVINKLNELLDDGVSEEMTDGRLVVETGVTGEVKLAVVDANFELTEGTVDAISELNGGIVDEVSADKVSLREVLTRASPGFFVTNVLLLLGLEIGEVGVVVAVAESKLDEMLSRELVFMGVVEGVAELDGKIE